MILAILLALIDAIYKRITPFFFSNTHLFPANEKLLLQNINQSDFQASLKKPIICERKRKDTCYNFLPTSSVLNQLTISTDLYSCI